MSIHTNLKYYKISILTILLTIFCSQQLSWAQEDSIFQRYAKGNVSIETYHDFRFESKKILLNCRLGYALHDLEIILRDGKKAKPDHLEQIRTITGCQDRIFERLKLYYGLESLDYNKYLEEMKVYTDLLGGTAELYLKMAGYYAAMGDTQEAKSIYRHVIVTYTDDIFKSYVKKSEFALKDLEDAQQRFDAEQKEKAKVGVSKKRKMERNIKSQ